MPKPLKHKKKGPLLKPQKTQKRRKKGHSKNVRGERNAFIHNLTKKGVPYHRALEIWQRSRKGKH